MGEPTSSEVGGPLRPAAGPLTAGTLARRPNRGVFTIVLREDTEHIPQPRHHRRVGRATLGCGGFSGARLAQPHPWGAPLNATRSAPNSDRSGSRPRAGDGPLQEGGPSPQAWSLLSPWRRSARGQAEGERLSRRRLRTVTGTCVCSVEPTSRDRGVAAVSHCGTCHVVLEKQDGPASWQPGPRA